LWDENAILDLERELDEAADAPLNMGLLPVQNMYATQGSLSSALRDAKRGLDFNGANNCLEVIDETEVNDANELNKTR